MVTLAVDFITVVETRTTVIDIEGVNLGYIIDTQRGEIFQMDIVDGRRLVGFLHRLVVNTRIVTPEALTPVFKVLHIGAMPDDIHRVHLAELHPHPAGILKLFLHLCQGRRLYH